MNAVVFIATSLAGGLGSILRFAVDAGLSKRIRGQFPTATMVINLSGSFALGLLVSLAAQLWLSASLVMILGTGLLGGYTTFSTASLDALRLIQSRRWGLALSYSLLSLMGSVLLAFSGLYLGLSMSH